MPAIPSRQPPLPRRPLQHSVGDDIKSNPLWDGTEGISYKDVVTGRDNILYLQVAAKQSACPAGAPFQVNFKDMGQDKCVGYFMTAVDGGRC